MISAISAAVVIWAAAVPMAAQSQAIFDPDNLAPYIPSPQVVVEKMLDAAHLRSGETLYDLGSGDGRVVIMAAQKFGARAVGVELSHELCERTMAQIKALGLEQQVSILRANLMKVDLTPADVVTIYLLTSSNERLKPNLEKYLKPGARVVSHDFKIRGWTPARVEQVQAHNRVHTIYVYEMRGKSD